jgi:hypothetical protein
VNVRRNTACLADEKQGRIMVVNVGDDETTTVGNRDQRAHVSNEL